MSKVRLAICDESLKQGSQAFSKRAMLSGAVFRLRATLFSALILSACGGSASNSANNGDGDGDGDDASTGGAGGEGIGGMDSDDPSISSYCQGLLDIDTTPEYEVYCADDPTYDPVVPSFLSVSWPGPALQIRAHSRRLRQLSGFFGKEILESGVAHEWRFSAKRWSAYSQGLRLKSTPSGTYKT